MTKRRTWPKTAVDGPIKEKVEHTLFTNIERGIESETPNSSASVSVEISNGELVEATITFTDQHATAGQPGDDVERALLNLYDLLGRAIPEAQEAKIKQRIIMADLSKTE